MMSAGGCDDGPPAVKEKTMTNPEFSTQFDILWNNISSNQAPGLNEYEKSVFLTQAQGQLVKEYFNSRTDAVGGGFDGSPKRQYDFSSIIKTYHCDALSNWNDKIDERSRVFKFPSDYFLSVNESINTYTIDENDLYKKKLCDVYVVKPIDYVEYQRLMLKPYKYPIKRVAWRLFTGSEDKCPVAEVIGLFSGISLEYCLRYIPILEPIILEDLTNYGVKIEGETSSRECQLPKETHAEILERAVTLAKIAWQGGTFTQATAKEK